ncbi:MAG: DUF5011 domain-containing protein [Candidatus Izemoplasma sp.]
MKKILLLVSIIILSACGGTDIEVVITPGFDIVEKDSEWIDEGCNLVVDGEEIVMQSEISEVDLTEYGEYRVIYSIEYEGKDYSCLRIVKVVDMESPVVVINTGIDTIYVGDTWIQTGVTATDNSGTNITTFVSGVVDSSTAGIYIIIYTVVDEFYNQTIVRRIVTVLEKD